MIGRGVAYRKTDEMDLLWSKQGPVDREGCGVPQNIGKRLVLERYGQNGGPVHREGCSVPQNGTPRDTVHLHRRPPPASTGSCSSTIDLLQPPPATVHPRALVHPASTARSSTSYCSTSPLHGVLFNHPSMGYCSSSPPPAPIHPALHWVLFIDQLDRSGYCSSTGNGLYYHGFLFIQPPIGNCTSKPPQQRSLFIQGRRQQCLIGFS